MVHFLKNFKVFRIFFPQISEYNLWESVEILTSLWKDFFSLYCSFQGYNDFLLYEGFFKIEVRL